ncbi:hypothetical protein BDV26DRAFT_279695 [Aspergillus bertholletiae]|uniref:Rhodopsin domain-containing protein n=1 Tax=Aspergillus bertholletiae TaxID=1226010 RepID=A0A5N7BEJ3_9EURO|nr:hypothetical protein BDV26DRAFT_279695 [Aspergillus bertholletiae]
MPCCKYPSDGHEDLYEVLLKAVRKLGRLYIGFIGYVAISFEADKVGSGIHEAEVAKEDLVKYAKLANASQIMYGPLIFITKLSILLLYLRVFAPTKKSCMYVFIHGLLWSNAAFYLADTLLEIFACVPREKIWHPDVHGQCINVNVMILATAILNTISDFSLLILPIFSVWRLHMRSAQKLGISAIFAAGLLSAEISAGIIASSLPAVPSFFRHIRGKAATVISSDLKSTSRSHRHNRPQRQVWNSKKRLGWGNGHDASPPQTEYNELDEMPEWRSRGSQPVGYNASSIDDSRTSQKGILKTVEIDVQATGIR